jgi:glycerophosphoryl diester phosphodiesterase
MGMRVGKCIFLDHDGPIPIAHRGGMGEGRAFGISTIERALALGCYIEIDVTATADGAALLWHPLGTGRVRSTHPLELTTHGLRIGDLKTGRDKGDDLVYRLDDVLGTYSDMRALIDVKNWMAVEPAAQAIASTNAVARISIGTFSQARTDATVARIISLTGSDHVCTAIGPARTMRLAARAIIRPATRYRASGSTAVQPPRHLVTRRMVEAAHKAGLLVFPWTVNEAGDMRSLLRLGVDGIITDYPTTLTRILKS